MTSKDNDRKSLSAGDTLNHPVKKPQTTTGISRRQLLQGAGLGVLALTIAPAFLRSARGDSLHLGGSLFSLGVVSGDPDANSVVLWTRLAPEPLSGGGMPHRPVRMQWEIAEDFGMTQVLRQGTQLALPRDGHALRVVARGLPSNRWLYYRFRALGETSRVGRTRTFPAWSDPLERMRCAVVSCQNYTEGFYPAYRDMLNQDLDFVIHTGDYIYENGPAELEIAPGRNHNSPEIFTVEDYRNRYALYRLDRDLQEAHAWLPFVVTWDDHEVDNNYAGRIAEEDAPFQGEDFRRRRANAYRVYLESMPLRPINRLRGNDNLRIFRGLSFGDLAEIHMLDTRQFRSDQPSDDGFGSTSPASIAIEPVLGETLFDANGILDPAATLLGRRQEFWLERRLRRSQATWNVLAQQVMVMPWNLVKTARSVVAATLESQPIPPEQKAQILNAFETINNIFSVDAWDGYTAARQRLFALLQRTQVSNPVVLSGDIHAAWGADLLADFEAVDSDVLAAEFVCTSISSTFLDIDPRPTDFIVRQSLVDNPHIQYFNGLFRGYCVCDVDHNRWQTSYRAVGDLARLSDSNNPLALVPFPDTPVETDAVLEIQAGFNATGSGKRLQTRLSRFPIK